MQQVGKAGGLDCIIGSPASFLPPSHVRITYDTTPFPRVAEAGFPRLSSSFFQGSYFLLVEEIRSGEPKLLAQAFRHVRQPAALIWGLQFFGEGTLAPRQIVGARASRDEVLNAALGWSLAGRLPLHDKKLAKNRHSDQARQQ